MIKTTRRTFVINSSRCVTLPRSWCQFYGERVNRVVITGSGILLIAPADMEDTLGGVVQSILDIEDLGSIDNALGLEDIAAVAVGVPES